MLPGLRALVTGGIDASAEAIAPWLQAGALAVGIGGALGSATRDGAGEVELRARALLEAAAATPG